MAKGIADLPNDTVIDGEIVALDENGKPSFNLLQVFGGPRRKARRNIMFLDRLPILFTWSVFAIPQSGVIRVDMTRGRAGGLG